MVSQAGSVVLPATDKISSYSIRTKEKALALADNFSKNKSKHSRSLTSVLAPMDHTAIGSWLLGLVAPVAFLGSKRAGGTSARHDPTVYLQLNILISTAPC